jgi:N utilization substance protein B
VRVRRQARILALQVLYETDTAQHPAGEVLQRHLRDTAAAGAGDGAAIEDDPGAREYAVQLVSGVMNNLAALDALLAACAPDFPFADIAPIDRNILRIALHEARAGLAPVRVAVNEAIEIAKQYGSDTAPRFINGALGAAVARLQAEGATP